MPFLKQLLKPALIRTTQLLGVSQSEAAVARDSARYWAGKNDERFRNNSHWREGGGGNAVNEDAWLTIGRRHLGLFGRFADMVGFERPARRVVEWGCGGGANAVGFAKEAERFVGVDVAQSSLDECGRQLQREGLGDRWQPVLADVENPEAAAATIEPCDLFLCVYVFELIPGPAYAERLLKIAQGLLRPGGMAMVQIKYATDDWRTRPRRWAYKLNLANTTTFHLEAFWQLAERCGLTPHAVTLVPKDAVVGDERYAYFLLTKPA